MIAAIYARKSNEQHHVADEVKSVARQIEHAKRYAAAKGWTIAEDHVYIDDGISGAEFDKRQGLTRLLNALRPQPPFDVLVMADVDRLGREQIETAYLLKQIVVAGVRVFDYLEQRERVLDSPADKLMVSVSTYAAEVEREKARLRTRDALLLRARQGHVTGGTVFGYSRRAVYLPDGRRSHVERVLNLDEAAIVRRIFEMCAAGSGFRRIAIMLNDEPAASPMPRRKDRPRAWSPSSVREILLRDTYRGVLVWGRTAKRDKWGQKKESPRPMDDWVRVEAPDLRIVSDELWEAVHARLRAARQFYERSTGVRPATVLTGKYLLSGFAACICGGAMIARSLPSGGERRYVYGCGYHFSRGTAVCDNALLASMDDTDQAVIEALERDVTNPRVVACAAEEAIAAFSPPRDTVDEERANLLGEMQRLEDELARLANAIARGGDVPALLEAVKKREAERTHCQRQLAALDSARRLGRIDPAQIGRQVREVLTDWQGLLKSHTPEAREVLRNVLEGRLIFTPSLEERLYTFSGNASLDRLIEGAIPAYRGLFNGGRGPNGIRTRVYRPPRAFVMVEQSYAMLTKRDEYGD